MLNPTRTEKFPVIWGAGDCSSQKETKRFICEKEIRSNPFLHRLETNCNLNAIKGVMSAQPGAVLSPETSENSK